MLLRPSNTLVCKLANQEYLLKKKKNIYCEIRVRFDTGPVRFIYSKYSQGDTQSIDALPVKRALRDPRANRHGTSANDKLLRFAFALCHLPESQANAIQEPVSHRGETSEDFGTLTHLVIILTHRLREKPTINQHLRYSIRIPALLVLFFRISTDLRCDA